jgi:hypothetical protein
VARDALEMTASVRCILNLALAVVLVGCGPGWHLVASSPSETPDTRQQFQVWSHGRAQQWHGLRVSRDSVSGVPFTRSPDCDSCRVQLARVDVDSLRVGDPVGGLWSGVLVGLTLGGLAYAIWLYFASLGAS